MSQKAEVVLTLKDNFSDALKKAQERQAKFTKDLEGMQQRLNEINRQRSEIKIETSAAQKALKEAEKAFAELNDEASKEALTQAQTRVYQLQDTFKAASREANALKREMEDLTGASSKLSNMGGAAAGEGAEGSGGGMNSFMGAASAIMGSQLFNQLSSSASAYLSANISSTYGSAVGDSVANIGGGILTGAGAGASMGMMFGPWGAAIGGAIGAGVGLISGLLKDGAQKQGEKDELFRGVVENIYDEVFSMREEMVSQGSSIAAQRETNLTAFSTLLRSELELQPDTYGPVMDPKTYADQFMAEVLEYSRTTPFGYEELVNISKTLLTYGYASERIIPMLTQIGDAGAALGWDASAKVSAATYIGRMQMSDKVTMQYLNPLIAQGLDVIGYIRQSLEPDHAGISNADVMEMISGGKLSGQAVSEVLLQYMEYDFGGAMEELQNSFDGLTSTLEDWEEEMQAALGEGYNERRKDQMKTQIEWYEEHADELTEMYRLVGEYEADLLGAKEETMRTSFEDLLERSKDITDPSEMSQELYNAIVDAKVAYYDTDAYEGLYNSQKALVNRIQEDLRQAHWDCGYELGQEFSKGYARGLESVEVDLYDGFHVPPPVEGPPKPPDDYGTGSHFDPYIEPEPSRGFAYGLDRVPYNNFPAMLHEGERVLTAAQARAADADRGGARNMTINIYNPTVRDDSDIDAIANAIYERLAAADATYVG